MLELEICSTYKFSRKPEILFVAGRAIYPDLFNSALSHHKVVSLDVRRSVNRGVASYVPKKLVKRRGCVKPKSLLRAGHCRRNSANSSAGIGG